MNLYGSITENNNMYSFIIAAGKDSVSMNVEVGKLTMDKTLYNTFSEVTAKDYIKNKKHYGDVKRPILKFTFTDREQLDKFIKTYDIEPQNFSKLSYYQKQMKLEDEIIVQQDVNQIVSMEELIEGKRTNKHTIGAIHNIDKYDPWDTMTEKEKAEQLLNNASDYNKLVDDGILTDEAMAPAIVNNAEHEKLPLLTYETLPKELLEDFKSQGMHKFDIEKKIEEINKGIEEHNKMIDEGTLDDHITRVIGEIVDKEGNISGKIHINKEKNKKTSDKNSENITKSSMKESIFENDINDDDAKFLIKKKSIDGKYISNLEDYIFENTSIDIYDINDFIENYKENNMVSTSYDMENNLKDISIDEKIFYDCNCEVVSDDDGIYISKFNITNESDIIGTNGIEWMSIHNGYFVFKPTSEKVVIVTRNSVFTLHPKTKK